MTATELKWYSDLRAELRKYDIPVNDLQTLQKQLGIRQYGYGYDVGKVISEFSESQSLETRRKMLQDSVRCCKMNLTTSVKNAFPLRIR